MAVIGETNGYIWMGKTLSHDQEDKTEDSASRSCSQSYVLYQGFDLFDHCRVESK
jgi:hypothetical protein